MGRRKTGKRVGRASTFSGMKLAFLEDFGDDFMDQSESTVGEFYTSVATRFVGRFGYDLAWGENLENKDEAWVDNIASLEGEALREELTLRRAKLDDLQKKLGQWFRHKYRAKKSNAVAINQILKMMGEMGSSRPRKKSVLSLYSQLHYKERIKPLFDRVWEAAKTTLPGTARVSMCREFVKAQWQAESEEFRAEIQQQVAADYAKEMEAFKAKDSWAEGTAESYEEALQNADKILIPLADAITQRFGMVTSILLVGPVGAEGGEVMLRSIFSDHSTGLTGKMWPEFDHDGFTKMEGSIMKFGRTFYSEEDKKARVVGSKEGEEEVTDPAGVSAEDEEISQKLVELMEKEKELSALKKKKAAELKNAAAATDGDDDTDPAGIADENGPPVEKVANPPADGSPVEQPTNTGWSDCVKVAYPYLNGKRWGEQWEELVKLVVCYERYGKFQNESERCNYKFRPEEFAAWMKHARPMKDWPVGENFGKQWHEWWLELVPEVYANELRACAEKKAKGEEVGEKESFWWGTWSGSKKLGPNGFLLAALGLAWWGSRVSADGGEDAVKGDEAWVNGVQEMRYAMMQTLQLLGGDAEEIEETLIAEENQAEENQEEEAAAMAAKKAMAKKKTPAKKTTAAKQSGVKTKPPAGRGKENVGRKRKRPTESDDNGAADDGTAAPPKKRGRPARKAATKQ